MIAVSPAMMTGAVRNPAGSHETDTDGGENSIDNFQSMLVPVREYPFP